MPTIPRLNAPQVTPNALPNARFTVRMSDAPYRALGEAINQVGQTVDTIYREQKDKADALAVMEADRKLSEWENRRIYDAEQGALNVKGRDAMALPDTVLPDLDTTIGEIEAGLANDEQRLAFRRMAIARRTDVDRLLQRHVAREFEAYDAAATDAYLANSVEAAAANYTNPERIAVELDRQRAALLSRAARTGEAAEVTQQKLAAFTSNTHVAVIGRMLAAGEYRGAREYLEANRDDIAGTAMADVEKAVRAGGVRAESQAQADAIMAQHTDRTAALAAARAIDNPEVRDAVVQRVNARFDEMRAIEVERRQQAERDAADIIERTGSVDEVPVTLWDQLDASTRRALEVRSRQVRSGVEPVQDDRRWYEFTQKTPDEIAAMNLYTELRPYVDDQHWDRAVAMQREIVEAKRGNQDAAARLTSTLTFKDRLANTLVAAGMFKKATGLKGDEAARFSRLETEAARLVQLREQELGRKATGNEIQEVIDQMVLQKVVIDRGFFSPARERLLAELADEDLAHIQVPDDFRGRFENLARSMDRMVTPDKIVRAYVAAVRGDDAAVMAILQE